jgi:hypothetical protein
VLLPNLVSRAITIQVVEVAYIEPVSILQYGEVALKGVQV